MAGIYIHVPFCKKVCSYCDFYKSTILAMVPDFMPALCRELDIRKDYLQDEIIETIYFGGGTPSLLSTEQINSIIGHVRSLYKVSADCEITVEANPDDLTSQYLTELSSTAVNRLSIGIQSFNDRDLRLLNRRHDAHQALVSIDQARKAGFNNISIDLIYGIPGMTNEEWQKNLNTLPEIEHISAYHLTVEPGTALFRKVSAGLLSITSEDESQNQFFSLKEYADTHCFIHYEISNLAKAGFYSRHNTSYWMRKKYLGAGPSAHSYDQNSRQWNFSDVKKYIDCINSGTPFFQKELLSNKDHFNEYLMVSLRTVWGANKKTIQNDFGQLFDLRLEQAIKPFIQSGHIVYEGSCYKMTSRGWLISDHIISRLISE